MYDANPPALEWRECEDDAAETARARLVDLLFLGAEAR
jgi:hypothetical protein